MRRLKPQAKSKPLKRGELTDEAITLIDEIFKEIDTDGSHSIDREEAVKYWGKNFAKINAAEFFNNVDINNDGTVEYDEWVDFWQVVKGMGHTDDEILEELQNLKDKEAWVGFSDIPKYH